LSAHGAAIDCVLLDVSMPGMDGPETFVKLRELKPDLKIALSSGHSIDDVAASFEGLSVAGFIQKPFQIDSLRDEVERILKS
jgi:DNA-binding NtrC family response regulator